MARRDSSPSEIDMTPMIDVVFQLIIFFIVTIKMEENVNPDIELEFSLNGPTVESQDPRTIVIEVDQRGWVSIHNAQMSMPQLQRILSGRYNRMGEFPVMIRGDRRTKHKDIRAVMDACTASGLWKIQFAAIKEKKF